MPFLVLKLHSAIHNTLPGMSQLTKIRDESFHTITISKMIQNVKSSVMINTN